MPLWSRPVGHPVTAKSTTQMTRLAIAILTLASSSVVAEVPTPKQPDTQTTRPYAGLNGKAIWSIKFWDKDGDNLLAWTENLMSQSGLSSEEASQLVMDEVDLDSTLYTPEKIAAKGGRAKIYQDGIRELVQEELDRKKGGPQSSINNTNESTAEESDSTAQRSQETASVPMPRYQYKEKFSKATPGAGCCVRFVAGDGHTT